MYNNKTVPYISLKFVGSLFIKHSHFSSDREIHRSYVDFTQQSRPSEIIKTIDYRQFIIWNLADIFNGHLEDTVSLRIYFFATLFGFTILRPPGYTAPLPGEKSLAVIRGKLASLKLFELFPELLWPSTPFEELAWTPFSVSVDAGVWSFSENTGKEAAPAWSVVELEEDEVVGGTLFMLARSELVIGVVIGRVAEVGVPPSPPVWCPPSEFLRTEMAMVFALAGSESLGWAELDTISNSDLEGRVTLMFVRCCGGCLLDWLVRNKEAVVLTSLFSAKRLGSRGRGCLWIDKALRCTTAPSVEVVDIGSVCKPRALLEELLRKEEGSPFTGCFAISGTDLVFLLSLMFIPLILDAMLVSPGTMCAKLGITGTIESSLPKEGLYILTFLLVYTIQTANLYDGSVQ